MLATSRAKAISWVARIIVVPSSASDRTASRTSATQLGVERGGDLVEEQQRRPGGQRAHQRHPLLLAAGEPVGVAGRVLGEPEPAEQLARPGLGLAARDRPCTLRGARVMLSSTVRCGNRL